MRVHQAIRDYLLADPTVAGMIGDRMVVGQIDQDMQLPAADIRVVTSRNEAIIAGRAGIVESVIAIDCYAERATVAYDLCWAIMHSGVTRMNGIQRPSNVDIMGVRLFTGPAEAAEGVDPGSADYRYVCGCSFEVDFSSPCD